MTDISKIDLRWIRGKTPNWGRTIAEVELIAAEIMIAEEDGTGLDWHHHFIIEAGRQPHSGDCSQCRSWLTGPITCDACVYDEYMAKAWEKKRWAMETNNAEK